eukprot:TRINITY_DN1100_c0_g2_i4.p3 TRINITY_DN1100_c0_g2~~TRINITY_DN1100_c0_g2_i4.p3  ORF type:complete len:159 (-),score=32.69 TRINITY_DN1100_c0_g2_i4:381-857(-)
MKKDKGRTKQQQILAPKSVIQKKQRPQSILQTALQTQAELKDVDGLKNFAEQQIGGLNQLLEDYCNKSTTKLNENTATFEKMMEDDFNKVVDVIKEADKLWAVMKEEYDEYMGQMDSKIQTFQKNFKKYEAQFLKEIADIKKGASEQLDCLQQKLHIK